MLLHLTDVQQLVRHHGQLHSSKVWDPKMEVCELILFTITSYDCKSMTSYCVISSLIWNHTYIVISEQVRTSTVSVWIRHAQANYTMWSVSLWIHFLCEFSTSSVFQWAQFSVSSDFLRARFCYEFSVSVSSVFLWMSYLIIECVCSVCPQEFQCFWYEFRSPTGQHLMRHLVVVVCHTFICRISSSRTQLRGETAGRERSQYSLRSLFKKKSVRLDQNFFVQYLQ